MAMAAIAAWSGLFPGQAVACGLGRWLLLTDVDDTELGPVWTDTALSLLQPVFAHRTTAIFSSAEPPSRVQGTLFSDPSVREDADRTAARIPITHSTPLQIALHHVSSEAYSQGRFQMSRVESDH
jgi:hypothetical protein